MPSDNSFTPAVERLAVEEMPTAPKRRTNGATPPSLPSPPVLPSEATPYTIERPAAPLTVPTVRVDSAVLTALAVAPLESLGRVVFPRLLLLLALIGAFVLAVLAMREQSQIGLAILIAFTLLTIGPLAWLERANRRG